MRQKEEAKLHAEMNGTTKIEVVEVISTRTRRTRRRVHVRVASGTAGELLGNLYLGRPIWARWGTSSAPDELAATNHPCQKHYDKKAVRRALHPQRRVPGWWETCSWGTPRRRRQTPTGVRAPGSGWGRLDGAGSQERRPRPRFIASAYALRGLRRSGTGDLRHRNGLLDLRVPPDIGLLAEPVGYCFCPAGTADGGKRRDRRVPPRVAVLLQGAFHGGRRTAQRLDLSDT